MQAKALVSNLTLTAMQAKAWAPKHYSMDCPRKLPFIPKHEGRLPRKPKAEAEQPPMWPVGTANLPVRPPPPAEPPTSRPCSRHSAIPNPQTRVISWALNLDTRAPPTPRWRLSHRQSNIATLGISKTAPRNNERIVENRWSAGPIRSPRASAIRTPTLRPLLF